MIRSAETMLLAIHMKSIASLLSQTEDFLMEHHVELTDHMEDHNGKADQWMVDYIRVRLRQLSDGVNQDRRTLLLLAEIANGEDINRTVSIFERDHPQKVGL